MWTSVLALSAFVTYVNGQVTSHVVVKPPPGSPPYKYLRAGKSAQPGEVAFDGINVYGWDPSQTLSSGAEALWKRGMDWFALRYEDMIYIVPYGITIKTMADLSPYGPIKVEKPFDHKAIEKQLNDGARIYLTNRRYKAKKKIYETNDFGFILVKSDIKYKVPVPQTFSGSSAKAKQWLESTKAISKMRTKQKAYAKTETGKKTDMRSVTGKDINKMKKEVLQAKEEKAKKSHGKVIAQLKKQKAPDQAMYADAGDYYGYAGEYYDEQDDDNYGYASDYYDEDDDAYYDDAGEYYDEENYGFQDIDASRLIQYAYDMGYRAGARKANRFKTHNDYYYR